MAWHHENEQRFEFTFHKVNGDCNMGILGYEDGVAAVVFTREALEEWIASAQDLLDKNPKGLDAQ